MRKVLEYGFILALFAGLSLAAWMGWTDYQQTQKESAYLQQNCQYIGRRIEGGFGINKVEVWNCGPNGMYERVVQ